MFPPWFAPGVAVALIVAYCIFVLAPIVVLVHSGWVFAGDPAEYLLTAHVGNHGGPGALPYVFPLLPAFYAPLGAMNLPFAEAYAVADVISGVLVLLLAGAFGVLGYVIGRSRRVALATAASAGTFPAILGEVGWGGQAQFVAIILGTLGVAFLLWEAKEIVSLRSATGAGVLFGVAALAEPYAAACFVVSGLVALLILNGRRGLRSAALAGYVPIVALPVAAVAIEVLAAGSSSPDGLGPPVLVYAATAGGWQFAVAAAGLGDVWTVLGYVFVLGALGAAALVYPGITRSAVAAVGAAVVAFLAEAFLITPATYWPRAASFFVVPIAVATAVLISRAPSPAPEPTLPRPLRRVWKLGHSPRAARWIRRGTAVVAIALVVAQAVAAYSAYPGDLQFNEFATGSVGQLSWLRGTNGSVVLVAPEALTFPVAYATERPLYPAVQPFWFDTADERSAAIFASTLVAGWEWVDAGPLELVEAGAPAVPSTPSLLVARSAYLIPVGTIVEEEGGAYALTAPTPIEGGRGTAVATGGAAISGSAHLRTYNVSTVASVNANGSVGVDFTFERSGGLAEPVGVGLAFPEVGLIDPRISHLGGSVTTTFQESGGTAVRIPMSAALAGDATVSVADPEVNTTLAGPTLMWNVTPSSATEFNVTLTITLPTLAITDPTLETESTALAQHGVRWVVVDTSTNATFLPRFELDPLFTLDRASPSFSVYQVA